MRLMTLDPPIKSQCNDWCWRKELDSSESAKMILCLNAKNCKEYVHTLEVYINIQITHIYIHIIQITHEGTPLQYISNTSLRDCLTHCCFFVLKVVSKQVYMCYWLYLGKWCGVSDTPMSQQPLQGSNDQLIKDDLYTSGNLLGDARRWLGQNHTIKCLRVPPLGFSCWSLLS